MFHGVQSGDPHNEAVCTAMQPSFRCTWRQHMTPARLQLSVRRVPQGSLGRGACKRSGFRKGGHRNQLRLPEESSARCTPRIRTIHRDMRPGIPSCNRQEIHKAANFLNEVSLPCIRKASPARRAPSSPNHKFQAHAETSDQTDEHTTANITPSLGVLDDFPFA